MMQNWLLYIVVFPCLVAALSSSSNNNGLRLNKIFGQTLSRRQADALVSSGRVQVNGVSVQDSPGTRVLPGDEVLVDGKPYAWEQATKVKESRFYYIKYWKPCGVICTTDRRIQGNLLDALRKDSSPSQQLPKTRLFPVGRLDKDTSGLLLVTSDGRVPNSVLRGQHKQPKVYEVTLDRPISESAVQQLRDGVVITTQAQRDRQRPEPLTARTLPAHVEMLKPNLLQVTIVEGRNRQVRKMVAAVGYTVRKLHRVRFLNLSLDGLQGPGDWTYLSGREQAALEAAVARAEETKKQ